MRRRAPSLCGDDPLRSPDLLARAAEKFGTPLYLYDLDAVERRAAELRSALGQRFTLAYAVKANPSLAVLSLLARKGLGADVASRGELRAARAAGFPPSRILATGPAKSEEDLEAIVRSRVSQLHAEGPWELDRLEAIASRRNRRVGIGLRLNPPWGISETRTIIGGPGAKKFGFDLVSARRALAARERWPHLVIRGFQVFNASNVLDADLLVGNTRKVLALAAKLARAYGVPLGTVDFGGGLGVPYAPGESPLDLGLLASGLASIARDVEREPLLRETRLVFEPGRYLVAEAGVYVTRVLGTKRSRGVTYALVDGGIHHLLRPALFGTPHAIERVGKGPGGPRTHVVVAGPLCTSLDLLHPGVRMPLPDPGDLLVVRNAGAYGYTESMPLFLSHEWPAEVGLLAGRLAALRRPPSASRLLAEQVDPFPPRRTRATASQPALDRP